MNISDIRIRKVENDENKLRGIASITIDDIKIIEGKESLFIAMPSRKTKEGEYKDIAHPINSETRQMLSDAVLKAYNNAE